MKSGHERLKVANTEASWYEKRKKMLWEVEELSDWGNVILGRKDLSISVGWHERTQGKIRHRERKDKEWNKKGLEELRSGFTRNK